ncbi:hypothetical protein Hanom_Chr07g00615491 [Helianthus anomalus]
MVWNQPYKLNRPFNTYFLLFFNFINKFFVYILSYYTHEHLCNFFLYIFFT